MRLLSWLFRHDNAHLTAALRESDELTESKQVLTRYTRDLEAGRIREGEKVLHLRKNVLEQALLNDRLNREHGQ